MTNHEQIGKATESLQRHPINESAIYAREQAHGQFVDEFLSELYSTKNPVKAEKLARADLKAEMKSGGINAPETREDMGLLAESLSWQGKHSQSADLYKKLLAAEKKAPGEYGLYTQDRDAERAGVESIAAHRPEEAEKFFREKLAIAKMIVEDNNFGPPHSGANTPGDAYSTSPAPCTEDEKAGIDIWHKSGAASGGEAEGNSHDTRSNTKGPDNSRVAKSLEEIGDSLSKQHKFKDAEDYYKKSWDYMDREKSAAKYQAASVKIDIVSSQRAQGKEGEAEQSIRTLDDFKLEDDSMVKGVKSDPEFQKRMAQHPEYLQSVPELSQFFARHPELLQLDAPVNQITDR